MVLETARAARAGVYASSALLIISQEEKLTEPWGCYSLKFEIWEIDGKTQSWGTVRGTPTRMDLSSLLRLLPTNFSASGSSQTCPPQQSATLPKTPFLL